MANDSVSVGWSSATVPSAQTCSVPGSRKKRSPMSDSPPARHRHRAVLERHVAQVGRHGDRRRRAGRRAGPPGEVHAVVVEAEARDRRRVPPVEVERLPVRVDGQSARSSCRRPPGRRGPRGCRGPQGVGQLAQPGERSRVSQAPSRSGVGREAALAEGGVAPAVEHEVALSTPPVTGPRRTGWSSPSSPAGAAPRPPPRRRSWCCSPG